jgi:hypothetical protein
LNRAPFLGSYGIDRHRHASLAMSAKPYGTGRGLARFQAVLPDVLRSQGELKKSLAR